MNSPIKRDLIFAQLGNGITVYDRLHEQNGDYEKVAHINTKRIITYYSRLNVSDIREIENYAHTQNPSVSHTQSQKVFEEPAIKKIFKQNGRIISNML